MKQYNRALLVVLESDEDLERHQTFAPPFEGSRRDDWRSFADALEAFQVSDPDGFDEAVRGSRTSQAIAALQRVAEDIEVLWIATDQVAENWRAKDFFPQAELMAPAISSMYGLIRHGPFPLSSGNPQAPEVEQELLAIVRRLFDEMSFDLVVLGNTGGGLRRPLTKVLQGTVPLWVELQEFSLNDDDYGRRSLDRTIRPLDQGQLERLVSDSLRFDWQTLAKQTIEMLEDSPGVAAYRVIDALRSGREPDQQDLAELDTSSSPPPETSEADLIRWLRLRSGAA